MFLLKNRSLSPTRFRWGLLNYLALYGLIIGVSTFTLSRLFTDREEVRPRVYEYLGTYGASSPLSCIEQVPSDFVPELTIPAVQLPQSPRLIIIDINGMIDLSLISC